MSERPNRIVEFLKSPLRPEGEASRGNRRRRSRALAELSWLEPPADDRWRSTRGRLRDISRAGVAIAVTTAPPPTARARIRLTEGDGTPWVEAEIVGVGPEASPKRRFRVRLRFLEPCPNLLLREAILSVVPGDEETETPHRPDSRTLWNVDPPFGLRPWDHVSARE
jgi:hypothetical protein